MQRSLGIIAIIATVGLACWPAAAVDRPANCERWGTGEVRCSASVGPDFEDVNIKLSTGKMLRTVKFKFEAWEEPPPCGLPDLDGEPSVSENYTFSKGQSFSHSKGYKAPWLLPNCYEAYFTQCTVNEVAAECFQVLGFE